MAYKVDYEQAYRENGFAVCEALLGQDFVIWFNTEYTGFGKR